MRVGGREVQKSAPAIWDEGGRVRHWYCPTGGRSAPTPPARILIPQPLSPSGLSTIAIALGNAHTCLVVKGGGVKCWGANGHGQLGIGRTSDQYYLVDVDLGPGYAHAHTATRACGRIMVLMEGARGWGGDPYQFISEWEDPDARNLPLLLCHERFNDASLPGWSEGMQRGP